MSTAVLILLILLDVMFVHDRIMKKAQLEVELFSITTFMGAVLGVVAFVAIMLTWALGTYVLAPFGFGYLNVLFAVLIVAGLVALSMLFMKKKKPAYYELLGSTLPLMAANCAIFGVALQCAMQALSPAASLLQAALCGLGFLAIMLIVPGLYERIDAAPIPESFRGPPLSLITGAIIYVSFMGVTGLFA